MFLILVLQNYLPLWQTNRGGQQQEPAQLQQTHRGMEVLAPVGLNQSLQVMNTRHLKFLEGYILQIVRAKDQLYLKVQKEYNPQLIQSIYPQRMKVPVKWCQPHIYGRLLVDKIQSVKL